MKRQKKLRTRITRKLIAFAEVPVGGYFYVGVGFHVKRTPTTADYFALRTSNNRYDEMFSPETLVSVDDKREEY